MFNKEFMSVEEYEKGESVTYYYNREDRLKKKRKRGGYIPDRSWSPISKLIGNKSKAKKSKNLFALLNLIFLLVAVVVFFAFNFSKKAVNKFENVDFEVIYKVIDIGNSKDIYIYFTNKLEEELVLNFDKESYIEFLDDDDIVHKEILNMPAEIILSQTGSEGSEEAISFKSNISEDIIYNKTKLKLFINGKNDISLKEEYNK